MDIVLDGISKSFNGKKVIDNFSAVFQKGMITAIMAPSGKGKTTLINMIMGLEKPDSGAIKGMEGMKKSAVFQEDRLCENLSAASNVRLVNPDLSRSQLTEAFKNMGLESREAQPVSSFSGGMRRRTAILRALLCEFDVLFLDEPFKGLDSETKLMVMDEVKKKCDGKTVFLVTHDAAEAEAMGAQKKILL